MSYRTLDEKLEALGGAVRMARRSPLVPGPMYGIPPEFSNWRDEQLGWRKTAAFFDMTHHMTDLYLEGPDMIRLLRDIGVNSFAKVEIRRAKQFICCSPDGYVIGDLILCFLADNKALLNGLPPAVSWIQYHALSGRYEVSVDREEPTAANPSGKRKLYRFQVQGPAALKTLERASGAALPEIKFFHVGEFRIAGKAVSALGHNMAGAPGMELFGPWEEGDAIKAAILEAGESFGLRRVGARALIASPLESGWVPLPLPAIFTGEALKAYRQWLPAQSLEAMGSLGGSFDSENIADYYLTPYELGYGSFVKFDHDFIGRQALEAMGDQPRRRKVTLAWNADDVSAALRTLFDPGDPAKYIELPGFGDYAIWQFDQVLKDGARVGLSTRCGYSYNARSLLSLAIIDTKVAIGTEVTLVWGEEGGGSGRPVVERHVQAKIRAIVSPCPYAEVTRTAYAAGWRTVAI